jgi:hypothetical protein
MVQRLGSFGSGSGRVCAEEEKGKGFGMEGEESDVFWGFCGGIEMGESECKAIEGEES